MAVMFVWTDLLADVVASSGLALDDAAASQVRAWRNRPSAYRLPEDGDIGAFAAQLLGVAVSHDVDDTCPCGVLPAAAAG